MVIPEEILVYLQNLLDEAGFVDLTAQEENLILQQLFSRLDEYLIECVVDHLPEEKLVEFTVFMQQKPEREQIDAYLHEHVPNIGDIFTVAFADFRTIYISTAKEAQQPRPVK